MSESTVEQDLQVARDLKELMPEFFAGFDLVAQEDIGYPLADFIGTFSVKTFFFI